MSLPRVVVVGSVNEDLVVRLPRLPRPGETVTGGTFARFGGGKGANAAVAAARSGADVLFVGAVGADELGGVAVGRLAEEGLDVSGVCRVEGEATGVALIVVDEAGENQIAVAAGANARLDGERVRAALAGRELPDGGVCVANLEVGDEAILAGARAAAAAGWRFVLDPAPARSPASELMDLGPILTPNEGEALALSGEEGLEEAVETLTRRTGAPVIVTRGASGAWLVDESGRLSIPAPAVEVVDATGAGDAFTGALAARLASGASLREAAIWGVAAASLSVSRPGARDLHTSRDAVESRATEIAARVEERA